MAVSHSTAADILSSSRSKDTAGIHRNKAPMAAVATAVAMERRHPSEAVALVWAVRLR